MNSHHSMIRPQRCRIAPALAATAVAAVALLGSPQLLRAESREPASLDDRIRAADIVFEGTVQAVEFRNARGANGKPGIPHTFVTWQIHRIFKGRTQGATLTARFFGGMPNADELLSLSHSPWPDTGDRDIVFLRGNGRSICPLVGCEDGRFRIVAGQVFGERGRGLSIGTSGFVRLGETSDDPSFSRWNTVGIEHVRGGADVDGDLVPGTTPSENGPLLPAMSAAALRDLLDARVHTLYTPAQLNQLEPVRSLDPERPFRFRSPRPVRARLVPDDGADPGPNGKSDPAEVAAYLAGKSNPVIPRPR